MKDFACTLFRISTEAVPLELFLPKREEEELGGFSKAKSSWDLKLKISLRPYLQNNKILVGKNVQGGGVKIYTWTEDELGGYSKA